MGLLGGCASRMRVEFALRADATFASFRAGVGSDACESGRLVWPCGIPAMVVMP